MLDKKIQIIIVKYLTKSIHTEEMLHLTEWLKKECNQDIFKEYVRVDYLSSGNMVDFDTEKGKEKVFGKIQKNKKRNKKRLLKNMLKYAAIFVLFIGMGYLYHENNRNSDLIDEADVSEISINPGTDKAILTLGNGDQVVLEKGNEYESDDAVGNGRELVYTNKNGSRQTLFNHLSVPRGGRFYVKLSDGTEVWLNSESKLKYPVSFSPDEQRKVELIYGEAYFKVSPSENNNGSRFSVISKNQEINVLGTEFNLRTYLDETITSTTLVEGSVNLLNSMGNKTLLPGQQAIIEGGSQGFNIREVDIPKEIAWVKGLFFFDDDPLEKIMKDLSRWYDVEVVFKSSESRKLILTGILERANGIEKILGHIEASSDGKVAFEVINDIILVK